MKFTDFILRQFCLVGINVHLVMQEGPDIAATITKVIDKETGHVFLHLMPPPDSFSAISKSSFLYSEKKEAGTWHFIDGGNEETLIKLKILDAERIATHLI